MRAVLGKLRQAGPRALPPLIAALPAAQEGARKRVVDAIAQCGPAALPPLTRAAGSEDPRVRRAVALALKRLALPESLPLLRRLLGDPNERVRVYAAQAIGRLQTGAARNALLSALPDERDTVSLAILRSLADSPAPAVERGLQRLDGARLSPAVQAGVAWALEKVTAALRTRSAPGVTGRAARPPVDPRALAPFGGALSALPAASFVGYAVPGTEAVAAALLRWLIPGAEVLSAGDGAVGFTVPDPARDRMVALRAFQRIWAVVPGAPDGAPHEENGAPAEKPAWLAGLRAFIARKQLDSLTVEGKAGPWARELAERLGLRFSRSHGNRRTLRLRQPWTGPAGDALWVEILAEADFPTLPYAGPTSLNRALAACLCALTRPEPADVFCDPLCGAGSLLIERALLGPARRLIGGDREPALIEKARANGRVLAPLMASPGPVEMDLQVWDARTIPLEAASVDAIAADFPFGLRSGEHGENAAAYPAWLAEISRVLRPERCAVVLSQEKRLMARAINQTPSLRLETEFAVQYSGVSPTVYVLQRV